MTHLERKQSVLPESTAAQECGAILQRRFGLLHTLFDLLECGLMEAIGRPIRGALCDAETIL